MVSWLNRGTLHLVSAEDYWWLHPLTNPQLRTGNARRLAQEGVPPDDAERGVGCPAGRAGNDGPLTRAQLRERVAAAGVRTEGQAHGARLLALASIRGLIVRGPMHGKDQAFVLVRDWLGAPPPPLDREAALGELARRYLAGHAPAGDADLAKWAGIGCATPGPAGRGAARCSAPDGLAELPGPPSAPPPCCRRRGCSAPSTRCCSAGPPGTPSSARTGTSSPTTGCSARSRWPSGRAVATWTLTGGRVVLTPFTPLGAETVAALDTDAADVTRFLAG